jgi:hypothetical protein
VRPIVKGLKVDVEETLRLNSGDLPELREQAWKAFLAQQRKHAPGQYGRPAWAAYFEKWIKQGSERLPEMVGVVEAKLR